MRTPSILLVSTFTALFGCATAPNTQPPAAPMPSYITAQQGCAVLVGGSVGSGFAESKVNAFWHEVNKQISDRLYDNLLLLDKYKVVKLTISLADHGSVDHLVTEALARHRCNRIIQLSHDVNEDSKGRYFRFDVSVLRIEPKGVRSPGATKTTVVTVGDYRREYRYPRTTASFDSFHTGTFAMGAYVDLKASGSLEALR